MRLGPRSELTPLAGSCGPKTSLHRGYGTAGGPFSSDTMTNTYNNRLRTALALQQATGVWTNGFGYDAAKRLTNVTSQAGSFAYAFNVGQASRLINKLSLPNSSYITNTFDSVARLTGTWLKNSTNGTLNSHEYTYNQGNQRTQQVFSAGSTYNYTYDAIGQLKTADSGTASEDRGYVYDAAWNLNYRTNNVTTWTFTVNTKNELTNAFSSPYTYDGNGNLTWGNSARNNYIYDDENRLVQWFNYYNPNGSPLMIGDLRTDFVYDGLGRLRSRSEYQWTGGSWYPNGTTYYVYDGMRVIQERVGSPTVSYTRGSDLSGSLEGAGGIGGLLARSHAYQSGSGNFTNHNCYHADGNGNVTYLVNSSQALAASYRYDPYGSTISSSGTLASANVYRFSSKELHVNSGLYYYGYRWYHPNLQRWLNSDPIGEEGGVNLFRYAWNSPPLSADAWGLTGTNVEPPPPMDIIIPPDPGPKGPVGTPGHIPILSGNGPPAIPGTPTVRLPTCENQGEQRMTKPSAPTGETCPCTNLPIKCFSYEKCELIPISQGSATIMGLRWVPYTRCTKCPEY